jgi:hydrogenase maturation protein HypF
MSEKQRPATAFPAAALHIRVQGIVQGVGFRPFVYGLAQRHGLAGWVRNTSAGVEILVEGPEAALGAFLDQLESRAPPLAQVEKVQSRRQAAQGLDAFRILTSQAQEEAFQPVSPDVSVCDDCLRELYDPQDRRYRYPFINCTQCGPRYTIIRDVPYDRPLTTMASFEMCSACAAEYHDPADRRFHAQPIACPACGPQLRLEVDGVELARGEEALQAARRMLREGKILAIKGLGGYHLACDATNSAAVRRLRQRKGRPDKPLAVMMPDLDSVSQHCRLQESAEHLLTSRERPIVLLDRLAGSSVAPEVAPGQSSLGVMLPYTPLHVLLLEKEPDFPPALVMTSGNLSQEPIIYQEDLARQRLGPLVEAILSHDRPIHARCDDSVARAARGRIYPLRRARGYAPAPLSLPQGLSGAWLGTGAELKNTFCLTRQGLAFLSPHIGDLSDYETLRAYEAAIAHYEALFRLEPQGIACDLHPDYLATTYARQRAERQGLPLVAVQHHHAHIAALMADQGLSPDSQVLGVAFDGTGYGEDGTIWGGEFLLAAYASYTREAHLKPVPMPGGDLAIRQPWRMALAWLWACGLPWQEDLPPVAQAGARERHLVAQQIERGINAPLTSSMGRLFDAVAALIGVRQRVTYEAQAAMELEALADADERGAYPFDFAGGIVDPGPALAAALEDLRGGVDRGTISARFHHSVARMVVRVCQALRDARGIERVALSGGVWQNMLLLRQTVKALEQAGFRVLLHQRVPANDGGLALGQVAVAIARQGAGD